MLTLTDSRKPYTTELDQEKRQFAAQVELAQKGQSITDVLISLDRAEQSIIALHKEVELYKKTWLCACHDVAELIEANRDRRNWAAAWKSATHTWRKIARHYQAKITLQQIHIETQNAVIQDLKAKLEKRND